MAAPVNTRLFTVLAALGLGLSLGWAMPAQGKVLCVNAPRVHLRSGPGTKYTPPTWTVHRHTPLLEVGRKGDWVEVKDVDGERHWIPASQLTDQERCVTIKTPKANIRNKPTSASRAWFTVEKYASFKRLGKRGKWVKLEYQGKVLWVFHTLVWP